VSWYFGEVFDCVGEVEGDVFEVGFVELVVYVGGGGVWVEEVGEVVCLVDGEVV